MELTAVKSTAAKAESFLWYGEKRGTGPEFMEGMEDKCKKNEHIYIHVHVMYKVFEWRVENSQAARQD